MNDDFQCTDCEDTGTTLQTERPCSCVPTDTPGTLDERLRRNSGWRNERHQCVTDPNLLTEAADEIASLRARVEVAEGALQRIADCDKRYLSSASCMDLARQALKVE